LGWFKWIRPFSSLANDFVLHHQSLDNYLFVRFFKMVCGICLNGTILTWVTLLWINATGGGDQEGLSRLAINNVVNPNRYYAHAAVAIVFFGM
jgi:calcium permeable stress-gated cation channel